MCSRYFHYLILFSATSLQWSESEILLSGTFHLFILVLSDLFNNKNGMVFVTGNIKRVCLWFIELSPGEQTFIPLFSTPLVVETIESCLSCFLYHFDSGRSKGIDFFPDNDQLHTQIINALPEIISPDVSCVCSYIILIVSWGSRVCNVRLFFKYSQEQGKMTKK